ncbi:MAG: hypothetical protein WB801_11190 [Candidatus Dormiibacterota bacterium]
MLDPELLMFGHVWVPGVGVAVELEVELTRTWAEVTAGDALAAAVVREAMPNPSPANPARATPTRASLIAIRLIIISLVSSSPIGEAPGIHVFLLPVKRALLRTAS